MVNYQVTVPTTLYIQYETTNTSFVDMHYYLKMVGINNNNFFLTLYDPGLAGVDPRDPLLPQAMKMRILRECICNYWYFLRECVRIPVQGAGKAGIRYKLHRGNLAMNFLFTLNYNAFVELPRQWYKTKSALCRYLWCFNFGTSNSEIMFMHKDHSGSKGNLKDLKELRDMLPSYLQMSAPIDGNGKKLKAENTVESLTNAMNHNRIITYASARNRDTADRIGRGCTQPLQYYDEFAFMPYNADVYASAVPANSRASENAKLFNAPYGILITTTPGDLTTEEGMYAFKIKNMATPWADQYYDLNYEQLEDLKNSNTNTSFFLIRYTYQQLGGGEEYFKRMVIELLRDWPKIRREVLLEWAQTSTNNPFQQDKLDMIKDLCHEPIRTIFFGRSKQYQFLVYDDIDLRYPPIVGVDVSGSMNQDSSAITVIDSKSTKVCATLNCNYIPTDDLADVIYTLVTKFMSNAIVVVERNGGFGLSVLQRLCKTSIKKNLYYEIKDKVIEESFNGVRVQRKNARVKVYGTDMTQNVRARMIEILYDRVDYHKDKFIAPILHHELETLEVKKNGRVEHADGQHDDQIFSYLHALRVWYDGENLAENFGIKKNIIKTDEDIEIEDNNIHSSEELKKLDLESIKDSDNDNNEDEKIDKFIAQSSRFKLNKEFYDNMYIQEQQIFQHLLNSNKYAKEAYETKYHIDPEDTDAINYIEIPDTVFNDFSLDDEELSQLDYKKLHGNLYDKFMNI